MAKKTILDLPPDLSGQKVLARFDLNVGIDEASGKIRNDRRIRAALPTLQNLLDRGAAVIAMSHLGRPKPGAAPEKNKPFAMDYVAKRIGEHLKKPVAKANDVTGPDARVKVAALKPGDVLVLENVRFDPREQPKKDGTPEELGAHNQSMDALAAELAAFGDIYVNDAFGTMHNKDVSVLALPKAMKGKPRVIGLLVEKELKTVDDLLSDPKRPMLAIMGGAKVSDKIKFITVLLEKVDRLLVGGKLTYAFMKATGANVGDIQVDDAELAEAKKLLPMVGTKIVLAPDSVVANKDNRTLVAGGAVPAGYAGVDIGPGSIVAFTAMIRQAATVIWNGPVGWFEHPPYDKGTKAIADAMAKAHAAGATAVVGGGETAEAVEQFGLINKMSHVSTGGGAFLKYVEDRNFKTLDQIDDK